MTEPLEPSAYTAMLTSKPFPTRASRADIVRESPVIFWTYESAFKNLGHFTFHLRTFTCKCWGLNLWLSTFYQWTSPETSTELYFQARLRSPWVCLLTSKLHWIQSLETEELPARVIWILVTLPHLGTRKASFWKSHIRQRGFFFKRIAGGTWFIFFLPNDAREGSRGRAPRLPAMLTSVSWQKRRGLAEWVTGACLHGESYEWV